MPRLPRWALRPLLGTTVALTALAACAGSALAAISVTLQPTRGESVTISTDGLDPEVDGARYTIRERDGTVRDEIVTGFSIRQLLERANMSTGYETVEIPHPDGRTLRFSRKQINASQPPPPVIYTDDDGVARFLRPQWGGEANVQDRFEIAGTLALRLDERSPIEVEVKASPSEIEEGESVTFDATIPGGDADDYVFHWDFRDGVTKRGAAAKVTHVFKKRGEYRVRVTASVPGGGEYSDPDEAEVTVGEPEESEQDRSGGGTNTTGGVDGGSSDGTSGGSATSGGGTSGSTPYSPSYTPPIPTPYTPAPAPPPPPTNSKPAPAPGIATDGSFVEGNLLAHAGDPPSGSILESAARAARAGTPRDDDGGGGVPEAVLSLAGALALLGLGAALELRQGPTLRLRRG